MQKIYRNPTPKLLKIIENRSKRSEIRRKASRSPAREDREDRDDARSMIEPRDSGFALAKESWQ